MAPDATESRSGPELPAVEVIAAIVQMIRSEVDRVRGPDVVTAADYAGWADAAPLESELNSGRAPGSVLSQYRAEAWEWFSLEDVALLDRSVVIVFRWLDPQTPSLRYVVCLPVEHWLSVSLQTIAAIVRLHLPPGNCSGWRKLVERILDQRRLRYGEESALHLPVGNDAR